MSDEEVTRYAQKLKEDDGICGKGELQKADSGLYEILRKRGLLEKVGFEEKRGKLRSWKNIVDEKVVEYARKVMEEKGIRGRHELEKDDSGLYRVLRKRGLLDEVGFKEKQKERPWRDMSDEEIVEFARKVMEEKGIIGRNELQKSDSGLYSALRKRGLLDRTFAQVEQQRTDQARDAVIDALTKFANSEKPEVEVA